MNANTLRFEGIEQTPDGPPHIVDFYQYVTGGLASTSDPRISSGASKVSRAFSTDIRTNKGPGPDQSRISSGARGFVDPTPRTPESSPLPPAPRYFGSYSFSSRQSESAHGSDLTRNCQPAMKFPGICTGANDFALDQYQYRMELKEESSLAISGATGSHQLKFGAHVQVVGRDNKRQPHYRETATGPVAVSLSGRAV